MELGPTELTPAGAGPHLEIGKDRLWVRYTGDGRHDVGAIQVRGAAGRKRPLAPRAPLARA